MNLEYARSAKGTGTAPNAGTAREVLFAALKLGLGSFGGPIAHLGYFERAYVRDRKWLSAEDYSQLVALCQLVPGPASSQLGFLIGLRRAGWLGAVAAWLGFTLPSALILFFCARLSTTADGSLARAVLHGLKLVAVAVVAQAVLSMARRLCPDRETAVIALSSAALLLVVGGAGAQYLALTMGALGGALLFHEAQSVPKTFPLRVRPEFAWLALLIFLTLLIGLPVLSVRFPQSLVSFAGIFYRAGALVFGGGHVVLPLLRDSLVPTGWLTDDAFLAGYGLAQAVPGPLFTVAAYLGASANHLASPTVGAGLALGFLFLPGLLLAVAAVSLWGRLLDHARIRGALTGVNAAVVGILGAALYDPVWTAAVRDGTDVAIVAVSLMLLESWTVPPLAIVALCVGGTAVRLFLS